MRTMRTALNVILFCHLLGLTPALAAGVPKVQITPGKRGSAVIKVTGAYSPHTWRRSSALKMTVPVGVARQLLNAARKGGVTVSTTKDIRGPMVRVVAGMGDKAVVVARYRRAGPNGQTSADGVRTVQYGVGSGAKAFYVGQTRSATTVKGKRFRGSSTVTRSGWSTFINPETLKPSAGKADTKLRWYWKPVSEQVGRMTNPKAPLDGFNPGDFSIRSDKLNTKKSGRVEATVAPATLINQLGRGL